MTIEFSYYDSTPIHFDVPRKLIFYIGPENLFYTEEALLPGPLRQQIQIGIPMQYRDINYGAMIVLAPSRGGRIGLSNYLGKKFLLETPHDGIPIKIGFTGSIHVHGDKRGVTFRGTARSVKQLYRRFVEERSISGYMLGTIEQSTESSNFFECCFVSGHSEFPFHLKITEVSN